MTTRDQETGADRGTRRRRHLRRAVIGVASACALGFPLHQNIAATAQAQTSAGATSVTIGTATRIGTVNPKALPTKASGSHGGGTSNVAIPYLRPYQVGKSASTLAAPQASGTAGNTSAVDTTILHNFTGLDSLDSVGVNAGDVEPPDQGLCVAPNGTSGTQAELEMVNLAVSLYDPNGATLLGPVGLSSFFGEPTAGFGGASESVSDPRCYYDPISRSLFATIIAYSFNSLGVAESHVDLAVDATAPGAPVNPAGPWTIYRIDTSDTSDAGCPCLADQPLLGVDNHGVYISVNEFTQPLTGFNGAQIYALSKSQLLAGSASPTLVHYGNLTIPGGYPAASLQPAQNPNGSTVEYFVNSLDPNATIDNRLGVWALTNTAALDSNGAPTLSHVIINSEKYGIPPAAPQQGNSFTLSPDDDRMQQVQFVNGVLWSALTSVVLVNGDNQSRAGAAWFKISPSLSGERIGSATVGAQGYVTQKGNYLIYPAIAVNNNNQAAMALTLTGPSYYPSAVYATGTNFSVLKSAALGTQPDHGFTCSAPYGPPCRWGDYSAAVQDPGTGNIWLATEFIANSGDVNANWATRVWDVAPQG